MALIIKRREPVIVNPITPPSAPPPVQSIASVKPKTVLKFGGLKPKHLPVKDVEVAAPVMTQRQQQKLIESGLMEPEEVKWEPCPVGTRVVITNKMFPWVKHYKPGDKATVKMISSINSSQDDKTGGHLLHVLTIDQPLDKSRMGQRAALFRWEFEKA